MSHIYNPSDVFRLGSVSFRYVMLAVGSYFRYHLFCFKEKKVVE